MVFFKGRVWRLAVVLFCGTSLLQAQGTTADYERSNGLAERYRGKLQSFRPGLRWEAEGVWWREESEGQTRFVFVDGSTGERKLADDLAGLGVFDAARVKQLEGRVLSELPALDEWTRSRSEGVSTTITFENRLKRTVRLFWVNHSGTPVAYGELAPGSKREMSTYEGHAWLGDFSANDLTGIFVAGAAPGRAIFDSCSRRLADFKAREKRDSGRFRVFLKDHNLFAVDREAAESEEVELSNDGTEEQPYTGSPTPSPNGRYVLAFQEQSLPVRRIPLLESAPQDQLQPRLHWLDYRKPGDAIEQRTPHVFDLEAGREVKLDLSSAGAGFSFGEAFSIGRVHWSPDSQNVHFLVNRRGHQQLTVVRFDVQTGVVKQLIDERSETFIDYSQKTVLHWLDSMGQVLWASERDGHNHLYRYDLATGQLINQVTQGAWVVRGVEHVDEEAQQVWFAALGIHPDQSPYHEHLVRVNFDGTDLTVMTESDGHHDWDFAPDRSLFVARWSRVDQPRVTELRRSVDGSLVAELGRDDPSDLYAEGYAAPQRFVAPGRDGETDIHGILIRPSNFDPSQRYPVVEQIYAGPHGHHVPVSWGLQVGQRRLAELGFVVAQIDGMGTNWRSKAFHDVCWQNLKDAGFPDRMAWLRAAAERFPELDLERVGIYGGSAGGQSALAAVLHHGDFYVAAAADCGCHDNRMDKIWWNEAWMGALGPHYEENANATHAAKLERPLLLTVGELDRNVDPASTLQVVDALIRANKDFEFLLVPGAGHGVGESAYAFRRRQDFFVRNMWGVEPRRP